MGHPKIQFEKQKCENSESHVKNIEITHHAIKKRTKNLYLVKQFETIVLNEFLATSNWKINGNQ